MNGNSSVLTLLVRLSFYPFVVSYQERLSETGDRFYIQEVKLSSSG